MIKETPAQSAVAVEGVAPERETAMPTGRRLRVLLGQDWAVAWVFILPTVLLMGVIIAYPFIRAVYMSFTNTTTLQLGPWVGLSNYSWLAHDHFYRESVIITMQFTFTAVFLKAVVGVIASLLLNKLAGRASILVGLVLLPWIMPDVVRAITWKQLLDPLFGAISYTLLKFHLIKAPMAFLGDLKLALPSVILINLWQGIPFFTINILAGLKAIDQELYEAAAIDGANSWRQFLHITLPGLKYVLIVVTLLSTIWTFNTFTLIFLLTGGGPMDATNIYSIFAYSYLNGRQYGLAVASALFMAPLLLFFIMFLSRYMMQGRTLYADTSVNEPGPISRAISWPFQKLVSIVTTVFWFVNDSIEKAFEAIARSIGRRLESEEVRTGRKPRRHTILRQIPAWFALLMLLTFELAPFYFVVVSSFKREQQISQIQSIFWPDPWSLSQFQHLLGPARNFMVWLRNTLIVSTITPLISVLVAAAGAYALTRLRWRGSRTMSSLVLIAYLMPGIMMIVPIYQIFSLLHLTDSLAALLLSYPTFALPFAIWLMMGYYATIPEELEAAALVDGCNRFQAFWQVVLPLTKPAMLAVFLFGVTNAWSEFLFAYVMISKESAMTVPVGLSQMILGDVQPWGELCAAALIMTVPVLIIYTLGQKYMVGGLTAGAVKGGG
jgi:multiple sugar transport system permease protein